MESLLVCFRAVMPIFLMMAMGYLAQRTGALSREDVPRLNRVAFRFFLSVTMFQNLYHSDVKQAFQPRLLLFATAAVLVEYIASCAYVLLTEKDPAKQGVKIQGIYRSNFVLVGLPLAAALSEGADLGPVVMMIAVIVPVYNVLAVITLEVFRGGRPQVDRVLLNIIKNPLIIGAAIGMVFLLTGLRLPAVLETTVSQVSAVSSPLMIFLLGVFFRFSGLRRYRKDLLEVGLGRLVIVPGIMLTAAYLMGFRGVGFAGLIAVFGSATAVSSFTMVQQLGGDDELAGDIVVVTSAACVVTLFGWSLLFKLLGAF